MQKFKPATALAAILVLSLPAVTHAQEYYRHNHNGATTGAVVGALAGGVIGSNLAAHGHRGDGTAVGAIVGGLAGGAIGNGYDKQYNRGYNDASNDAYYGNGNGGYYDNGNGYDDGQRRRVYVYQNDQQPAYQGGYYNNDGNGGYYSTYDNGDYTYGQAVQPQGTWYQDQPAYGSSDDSQYSSDDNGYDDDDDNTVVIVRNNSDGYSSGPGYSSTGWTQVPGPDCNSVCVTQSNGYATTGDAAYYSAPASGGYYYTSTSPTYSSQTWYRSSMDNTGWSQGGSWSDVDNHGDDGDWSEHHHHHHDHDGGHAMGFRDDRGQWHEGQPRAIGWQDQDGHWHEGQVTAIGWCDDDGNWHEQSSYSTSSSWSSGY